MTDDSSPSPDRSGSAFAGRAPRALVIACAALLLLEIPLLLTHSRHGYFGADGWFGFYALVGMAGAALLVLLAMGLARLVRRGDDTGAESTEPPPHDIDESLR